VVISLSSVSTIHAVRGREKERKKTSQWNGKLHQKQGAGEGKKAKKRHTAGIQVKDGRARGRGKKSWEGTNGGGDRGQEGGVINPGAERPAAGDVA